MASKIRRKALYIPREYFAFFTELNPILRVIFLEPNPGIAYRALAAFTEDDWTTFALYSLPQLKSFVMGKYENLEDEIDFEDMQPGSLNDEIETSIQLRTPSGTKGIMSHHRPIRLSKASPLIFQNQK